MDDNYNSTIYIASSIFIITAVIIVFYKNKLEEEGSEMVKSNVDLQYYRVKSSPQKQELADTISIVTINLKKLINHIHTKEDSFKLNKKMVNKRFNPRRITENLKMEDTSYTINKGEQIALCLSSRDGKSEIYPINVLMFVAIHELAHVGCISYGHNDEFNRFFEYLLENAKEIGVYEYVDYSKNPVNYCGVLISNNPS